LITQKPAIDKIVQNERKVARPNQASTMISRKAPKKLYSKYHVRLKLCKTGFMICKLAWALNVPKRLELLLPASSTESILLAFTE
jgi:hypothetical protein